MMTLLYLYHREYHTLKNDNHVFILKASLARTLFQNLKEPLRNTVTLFSSDQNFTNNLRRIQLFFLHKFRFNFSKDGKYEKETV